MYNLDLKKWTVEKMLGIEFFSFTSFYIMYMLFLKHNFHIDTSPYPLFLMFDLISFIYTRYRISKMEEPYGLLENIPEHLIHPSVRSMIRPDQWIYIQKND